MTVPATKRTSQYMDNSSYDETYGQNTQEILGFDGTNLQRIRVDTNGNLVTEKVTGTFVVKTVDYTAGQTAQAVWTPASGKKFVICDMIIASNAAGTLTLFDHTDNTTARVGKFYFAANGGANKSYSKPYLSATANNILKYTSDGTATGSITVSGYEI